jgi:hypothetical protein
MKDLKITDFTARELVESIERWIRESNAQYANPLSIADDLRDDSWLDWYKEQE